MKKLYHKLLAELRQLASSLSIAYFRKWLPATVLIGIVAGAASIAFFSAITWASKLFLGLGVGFTPPVPAGVGVTTVSDVGRVWMIPVIATIGGLISGLIVYRFAPEAEGHGTDAAIDVFHRKEGVVRPRVPPLKLIASAVTIGSGGSAGKEGPMALISAGVGSLAGRFLRLNVHDLRLATAVGIGIVAYEDILSILEGLRSLTKVEAAMSTNLTVIHPEETLEQALERMVAERVAVLPVVDKVAPTKLLGLVSRGSVIEAYESEAKKMMGEVHYA